MTGPDPRIRRRRRSGALIAAALAGIAGVATTTSSALIGRLFADRPVARDLALGAIPYARSAQYVADTAVVLAMVLLAVYFFRHRPRAVPEVVAQFSIVYLLRAGINLLTPLASPHGQELFGWLPSQNGMFPSGHSANVFLCVLIADKEGEPWLRWALLALAVTEWVSLLVSRGHYSIDIVGGLLLTYFVFTEWNRGTLFAPLKRRLEA